MEGERGDNRYPEMLLFKHVNRKGVEKDVRKEEKVG